MNCQTFVRRRRATQLAELATFIAVVDGGLSAAGIGANVSFCALQTVLPARPRHLLLRYPSRGGPAGIRGDTQLIVDLEFTFDDPTDGTKLIDKISQKQRDAHRTYMVIDAPPLAGAPCRALMSKLPVCIPELPPPDEIEDEQPRTSRPGRPAFVQPTL